VEQFRAPMDARVIELPAGLADVIDDRDEPLEEAARRELLEETGYQARQLVRLFHGPASPGLTSEDMTFFLAGDVQRVGPGGGDGHESIRVHAVPLPDVERWLQQRSTEGYLVDVKIYAGLYAATSAAG
jgi:ADP-ribose pyrophosphatase